MDTQKNLALIRKISQIKQLSSDVTLFSYYSQIKPFLFGSDDTSKPISKESLPSGGINSVIQGGKISPSGAQVYLKVEGRSATNYKIADVRNQQFINDLLPNENKISKKNPAEFLFPSDIIRILVKLANIFRVGDGKNTYNASTLKTYTDSSEYLNLINLWGDVGVLGDGFFKEKTFELKHSADIQTLLNAVVDAAIEFENKNIQPDYSDFEPQTEVEKKLVVDIVPKILLEYTEYQEKIVPQLEINKEFEEASTKISEEIEKIINEDRYNFFYNLFIQKNLDIFSGKIYDPTRKTFLFSRSAEHTEGLIETTQYLEEFVPNATKKFLDKHSDTLTESFITPLFTQEKKAEAAQSDEPQTTDEASDDESTSQNEVQLPEEIKQRLQEDISLKIYESLLVYLQKQHGEQFLNNKSNLETNHKNQILEIIKNQIQESILSSLSLSQEEIQILEAEELYTEGVFSDKIFESDWYKELVAEAVDYVIEFPIPNSQYPALLEHLNQTIIVPALEELDSDQTDDDIQEENVEHVEEENITDDTTDSPISGSATVPIITPASDPSPQTQTATDSQEINRPSPEQVRFIQYESAWMYNRAIYELFTSHGLDINDVDPVLLQEIQASVFSFTAGMESSQFEKLFASTSQRQKALLEFYKEFNQKKGSLLTSFYLQLPESSAWKQLNQKQKDGLIETTNRVFIEKKILSSQELLQISIKEAINLDSPVFTENVKNTIDAFIIQYGVTQEYYSLDPSTGKVTTFKGTTENDVIWYIQNIPPERLVLIFNLPKGTQLTDKKLIDLLKKSLVGYVLFRGRGELPLHIKSDSLAKGLILISKEDAIKIKNGDNETIAKHLGTTTSLRNAVQKNGGETVVGGLEEKKDSNRKKIIKEYELFLPLWGSLSGPEQAEVYRRMGIAIPPNIDLDIEKLAFIPEFAFCDISDLEKIKDIVANKNISKADREKYLEILAINEQLQKEETFAQFMKKSYEYYSDDEDINDIREYVGLEESESLSESISYREYYQADQDVQDGLHLEEASGFGSRFLNSKSGRKLRQQFKNRFKKKTDPREKTKKALKNAIGEGVSKLAAAGASLIIPGSGVALMAIKNKKLRNIISGAIIGGLVAIIGRTIWALGSIGGAIGGVIGGVLGGVLSGGSMIIPGVIVGANIGEMIIPTRWTGAVFNTTPQTAAAASGAATAGAGAGANAAAATALGNLSIGLLAPAGGMFFMVFITMYTIILIQSSFLLPIPQERLDVSFNPEIGSIPLDNCDTPGPLPFAKSTNPLAAKAFDIVSLLKPGFWCYWNWHPQYDGLNETFTSVDASEQDLFDEIAYAKYPNHCVYSANNPTNCTGDYRNFQTGYELFWCTWLVNKTYEANYSLGAAAMAVQFQTFPGHIFLPVGSITAQDVQPGDVMFTSTNGGGRIGHVAIVHSVGSDYILSVDSNAYSRYNQYPVSLNGSIQSTPYLTVMGFGRKL